MSKHKILISMLPAIIIIIIICSVIVISIIFKR